MAQTCPKRWPARWTCTWMRAWRARPTRRGSPNGCSGARWRAAGALSTMRFPGTPRCSARPGWHGMRNCSRTPPGRDDGAVEWVTKGLGACPGDPRLPALALDGHRKAGRRDQALAMLWRLFTLRPGIWTYQELKREAAADSARWAGRAVAHLRAIRPPLPAVLAEVLLAEGDVAAAWDLVSQDQDGAAIPVNLRMRVVAERAATHPGDVIPVYQDLAAVHVRRGTKPGYPEAIKYLKMAQGLAERVGAGEDFQTFMTELRAAHPGKKVLHQQLSEAGLP